MSCTQNIQTSSIKPLSAISEKKKQIHHRGHRDGADYSWRTGTGYGLLTTDYCFKLSATDYCSLVTDYVTGYRLPTPGY